jgi:hypothetical protein
MSQTWVSSYRRARSTGINNLTITTTNPLPYATQGVAYSFQLMGTGGVPGYTWSLPSQTGSNGWVVSPSGLLTGSPTDIETDTLTIQLWDSRPVYAQAILSITTYLPLLITSPGTLPNATDLVPYSFTMASSGGVLPALIWYINVVTDINGNVVLDAYGNPVTYIAGFGNTWVINASTGVVSGTPVSPETDPLSIAVRDRLGRFANGTFNLTTIETLAATPTFSPVAGTYTSTQSVQILCSTSGATIYYTLDGSTPNTGSSVYSTPISVSASETINAIATATGYTQSNVGSATYTINSSSSSLGFPLSGWFPDTAAYNETSIQQNYARYNYVGAFDGYLGQEQSIGMTFETVITSIEGYSASLGTQTICFIYLKENEAYSSTSDAAFPGNTGNVNLNALTAHPTWWLATEYPTPGPNSNTIIDGGTSPQYATLNTNACPSYSTAGLTGSVANPGTLNLIQWWNWVAYMHYCVGTGNTSSLTGGANMPVLCSSDPGTGPNTKRNAHIFHDNQYPYPTYISAPGNWLNTPTTYANGNETAGAAMALGYNQGLTLFRNYAPTVKHMGNCANLNSGYYPPGTQQLYDYPMVEWWGGYWEPGHYTNFSAMLSAFATFASNLTAPGGNWGSFFEGPGANIYTSGAPQTSNGIQQAWTNPQSDWDAADWQAFRYQAAATTMGGGIAMVRFVVGSGSSWFDEFDAGVGSYNWLGGLTVSPYSWSNGVWRADYQGGSILCNPWKNGAQTITMPYNGSYCSHTTNHSDPNYCKGTTFTSSTTFQLQDRDAIFIMR